MEHLSIPAWLATGTAPQWGMFVVVVLAFLKLVIPWRQQNISIDERTIRDLRAEVARLSAKLDECEENCRRRDEIVLGMKKQNIAQQISFTRILMNALGQESPELRNMLKSLESLEKQLEPVQLVEVNHEDH